MAVIRRRVIFSGRVQGVGFRATAQSLAGSHPVTGWVMNQPDGTVLLEVQGPEEGVGGYLADLRAQMGRMVKGEDSAMIEALPGERGFEVRR